MPPQVYHHYQSLHGLMAARFSVGMMAVWEMMTLARRLAEYLFRLI